MPCIQSGQAIRKYNVYKPISIFIKRILHEFAFYSYYFQRALDFSISNKNYIVPGEQFENNTAAPLLTMRSSFCYGFCWELPLIIPCSHISLNTSSSPNPNPNQRYICHVIT